jgi:hypothetical protein
MLACAVIMSLLHYSSSSVAIPSGFSTAELPLLHEEPKLHLTSDAILDCSPGRALVVYNNGHSSRVVASSGEHAEATASSTKVTYCSTHSHILYCYLHRTPATAIAAVLYLYAHSIMLLVSSACKHKVVRTYHLQNILLYRI